MLCHVHLFVLPLYGWIYGWIFKLKIKGSHVLLILYAVGKILLHYSVVVVFLILCFVIFFFLQLHELIIIEHSLLV